jgi:hypothetical protein
MREMEPLELTGKGNLPLRFCRSLVDTVIFDEDRQLFEDGHFRTERDCSNLHLANVISDVAGLTVSTKTRMRLAPGSARYLERPVELYRNLFLSFTRRLNWEYLDRYPEAKVVKWAVGFSCFLVQRHGAEPREGGFYAERFLKAFPTGPEPGYPDNEEGRRDYRTCYINRTFRHFMGRFGLAELEGEPWKDPVMVRRTPLLLEAVRWRGGPMARYPDGDPRYTHYE